MLRAFNSLQFVAIYAVGPWVIAWLFSNNPFPYSVGVAWVSIIMYALMTFMMAACVYDSSGKL